MDVDGAGSNGGPADTGEAAPQPAKRFASQAAQAEERKAKRRREIAERASAAPTDSLPAPYTWLWPPDAEPGKSRREIAVGALLCRPQLVQLVLNLLAELQAALGRDDAMELGTLVRGKVVRYTPPDDDRASATMSVHVAPTAAIALANPHSTVVPQKLKELLATGDVQWCPGLRITSAGCAVKSRPKEVQYREKLAEECRHRRAAQGVQEPTPEKARFRFAELFAGIGGFRVGLDALGGHCVFASEIDHEARCTYAANFGENIAGDITEVDASAVPQFDVLTGGFPCQSHSVAGFQRGFDDFRGCLFFEVTRMLRAHAPPVFLLENVPNLVDMNGGAALELILKELANGCDAGYTVCHKVINASGWAPQLRERLYFVGIRTDTGCASKFVWPEREAPSSMTIRQLLERPDVGESPEFKLSNHKWDKVQLCKKTNGILSRRLARLDGHARTLCSNYRRGYSHMSEFVPHFKDDGSVTDHQALFDARFPEFQQRKDTMASVVDEEGDTGEKDDEATDSAGRFETHHTNPRFYTPRECARIMGFPESFEIDDTCKSKHRIYHQLGNAVVPPVIEAIMRQILKTGVFGEADS